MRNGKRQALILAAMAAVGMAKEASGAPATWNLNPVSGLSWNTTNWTNGATTNYTPLPLDSLFFAASNSTSPNNNFAAGTAFSGITFNSGAAVFTLTGNGLNLVND